MNFLSLLYFCEGFERNCLIKSLSPIMMIGEVSLFPFFGWKLYGAGRIDYVYDLLRVRTDSVCGLLSELCFL
jgi:hypothetical protein